MDLIVEGRARTAAVTGGLVPTSVRVPTSGLALRCLVWGSESDPTALLLHGNGGHAHWWDALVPALVPGWRLVAPDLRGHGESDWAEPPRYRLEDFARDLTSVHDALAPGRMVLVGHSMGGRVAAWYGTTHPERVRGLVLLDSRMNRVRRKEAAGWRARVAGMRVGRGYATRDQALAAFRFVPDEVAVSPAIVADLAHHAIVERGPGDWTFRFDRAVLSLEGDGAGDLFPRLGRLSCPVLVMAGAASWIMDAAQRDAMTAAIPDCALRVFPGGHHFLVAQPGPVGLALRVFLDGLD